MTMHEPHRVVIWESPRGARLTVCRDCEARKQASGEWYRDEAGEELCQVYYAEHWGYCDVCLGRGCEEAE